MSCFKWWLVNLGSTGYLFCHERRTSQKSELPQNWNQWISANWPPSSRETFSELHYIHFLGSGVACGRQVLDTIRISNVKAIVCSYEKDGKHCTWSSHCNLTTVCMQEVHHFSEHLGYATIKWLKSICVVHFQHEFYWQHAGMIMTGAIFASIYCIYSIVEINKML